MSRDDTSRELRDPTSPAEVVDGPLHKPRSQILNSKPSQIGVGRSFAGSATITETSNRQQPRMPVKSPLPAPFHVAPNEATVRGKRGALEFRRLSMDSHHRKEFLCVL